MRENRFSGAISSSFRLISGLEYTLGRARLAALEETELLDQLTPQDYRTPIERGIVISVKAFDWNCPQHITPRYSEAQFKELLEQRAQS